MQSQFRFLHGLNYFSREDYFEPPREFFLFFRKRNFFSISESVKKKTVNGT